MIPNFYFCNKNLGKGIQNKVTVPITRDWVTQCHDNFFLIFLKGKCTGREVTNDKHDVSCLSQETGIEKKLGLTSLNWSLVETK